MKEIVEDMKRLCPDAWLINFTNPSGMITEAVIKHFGWKKCIGLCNVPVHAMMDEPKLIHKELADLTYQFAGLNHFHWHKVFDKDGNDLTDELIEHINDRDAGTPVNIFEEPYNIQLLHSMHAVPCSYHRYYYMQKEMLEHSLDDFAHNGTRAEQVKRTEHELFDLYKNPDLHEKPAQLAKRGGAYYSDAACVSTENKGAISCLDDDSIVEISCLISAQGARPLAWGKMPSSMKGSLQLMKAMEECVIEAAITGDYGKALEAFNINPVVENGRNSINVLNELLVAHEKYLPQFKTTIEKLKEKNIYPKDKVVVDLLNAGH